MAYCTTSDVQELYKSLTFSASAVSEAKVQGMIDRSSNIIDGRIGKIYTTPVNPTASPIAESILKQVCLLMVMSELDPILNQTASKDKVGREDTADKRAERMLCQIETTQLDLPDAVKGATSVQFASGNVKVGVFATFTKDGRQW